jgi:hypothetical protein
MKKLLILTIAAMGFLTACSDGVPKVEDPHKPVVDGQQMTPKNFLEKYCVGKTGSATCDSVKNAMAKDATKGDLPKGW